MRKIEKYIYRALYYNITISRNRKFCRIDFNDFLIKNVFKINIKRYEINKYEIIINITSLRKSNISITFLKFSSFDYTIKISARKIKLHTSHIRK